MKTGRPTKAVDRTPLTTGDRTVSSMVQSLRGAPLRYVLLGLGNAAVGTGLLIVLVQTLGVPYLLAHLLTHLIVVTLAYFPSSRWVFAASVPLFRGLARFHLSYALHIAISSAVFFGLRQLDILPLVPAQLVAWGAAALVSFALQRSFVFASPSNPKETVVGHKELFAK